jgi:hypothetical protein
MFTFNRPYQFQTIAIFITLVVDFLTCSQLFVLNLCLKLNIPTDAPSRRSVTVPRMNNPLAADGLNPWISFVVLRSSA